MRRPVTRFRRSETSLARQALQYSCTTWWPVGTRRAVLRSPSFRPSRRRFQGSRRPPQPRECCPRRCNLLGPCGSGPAMLPPFSVGWSRTRMCVKRAGRSRLLMTATSPVGCRQVRVAALRIQPVRARRDARSHAGMARAVCVAAVQTPCAQDPRAVTSSSWQTLPACFALVVWCSRCDWGGEGGRSGVAAGMLPVAAGAVDLVLNLCATACGRDARPARRRRPLRGGCGRHRCQPVGARAPVKRPAPRPCPWPTVPCRRRRSAGPRRACATRGVAAVARVRCRATRVCVQRRNVDARGAGRRGG